MNLSFSASGAGDIWAITSFYNPVGYRRRLENYRAFRARLNVPLVTLELAFDRGFELSAGDADILIQLRGGDVMWQKERLLNLALAVAPPHCRKIAWIDCDVIFDRADWAEDASRLLDRTGIVQLFSRACDMPPGRSNGALRAEDAIAIRGGLVFAIESGGEPAATFAEVQPGAGRRYARGFAWAARRELLERHAFFDECIIGGGDSAMASAWYGCLDYLIRRQHMNGRRAERYLAWAEPFRDVIAGEIGLVHGDVFHLWHGGKAGRQTYDRYLGLNRFDFDPVDDLVTSDNGVWRWKSQKQALHNYVRSYFVARAEDGTTETRDGEQA